MRWLAIGVWLIPMAAAAVASRIVWVRLGPDRLAAFMERGRLRWLNRTQMTISLFGWLPISMIAAAFAPWYANVLMAGVLPPVFAWRVRTSLRETRRPGSPTGEEPVADYPTDIVDRLRPRS